MAIPCHSGQIVVYAQMAYTSIIDFRNHTMGTTTVKESRLNIRCDSRARQLLDKAAGYARVSVSEFVLSHALVSAEQVVQAHESITLTPQDFEDFLAALDATAEANAPLERALERHAAQVRR